MHLKPATAGGSATAVLRLRVNIQSSSARDASPVQRVLGQQNGEPSPINADWDMMEDISPGAPSRQVLPFPNYAQPLAAPQTAQEGLFSGGYEGQSSQISAPPAQSMTAAASSAVAGQTTTTATEARPLLSATTARTLQQIVELQGKEGMPQNLVTSVPVKPPSGDYSCCLCAAWACCLAPSLVAYFCCCNENEKR